MIKELRENNEKMQDLIRASIDENGVRLQYLLENFEEYKSVIDTFNNKYDEVKNDEVNRLLFLSITKDFTESAETFQKIVKIPNDILTLILSQQIILTRNDKKESKYKIMDVFDDEKDIIKLEKTMFILGKIMSKKSYEEIMEYLGNAKGLIILNNKLKEENI